MKIIGLTGGIASGKSTVAGLFAARGIPVLDADSMAREVLKPEDVQKLFGSQFLENGQINRKKLAAFVFSDPEQRKQLEALTHPLIAEKLQVEIGKLEQAGHSLVIYEASLIFEKKLQSGFDATILVKVPESLQLERLMKREKLTEEEALARIRSQMPTADKEKLATYVIDNAEGPDGLNTQLNALDLV